MLRFRAVAVLFLASLLFLAGYSPPAHAAGGIAALATKPSGSGYWTVSPDGQVQGFDGAVHNGDVGATHLNRPIVGMASTTSGHGYWLVASDGGIFAFGDAAFFGSTGSLVLNQPIVGMAATPTGHGYWLVASDGGIFAFGDAPFRGSIATAGDPAARVSGMTPDGNGGYTVLRTDGGVTRFAAPDPAPSGAPSSGAPAGNGNSSTTTLPASPPAVTTTTHPTTTSTSTTSTTHPVTTSTTSTTSTTAPPSTTTSTTSTVIANGNPFAVRTPWVDPSNPARAQAQAWASSRPADADRMRRMGDVAAAAWIGEWSGDVTNAVRSIVQSGASTNTTPVLVAYNIPGRDCGQWSAGGAAKASDYQSWIRRFADGIGNLPAAVILEPDALPQLDCLDDPSKQVRLDLLKDAVNVLSTHASTMVYLDAGHPGWHDAATMTARLQAAGVGNARGFSLNVSNFDSTTDNVAFGNDIAQRLGGKHYVVDTSRNGNGSNGEWCNPAGRALGQLPTTSTGSTSADAFLWIKRPGESDGSCNGGPSAGTWWADYARDLAVRAWG